jgi:ABC-type antimicrobial peptide transport system permease subunit
VLVGLIAVFTLPLAAIGLTGAVVYSVQIRAREMALRAALGADPDRLRRGVVGGTLAVVGCGMAIGLVLGVGAGRLIASRLFRVSPADPLAIAAVVAVLLLLAWLSALWPARRAANTDPAAMLWAPVG